MCVIQAGARALGARAHGVIQLEGSRVSITGLSLMVLLIIYPLRCPFVCFTWRATRVSVSI